MVHNFIDETGNKYGRLTVIEQRPSKNGRAMWLCKCDCGNEVIVRGGNLRNGNTKSCGCLPKENLEKQQKQHTLDIGIASMRQLINCYKRGAKERGHEYNLTEEQFRKITQQNCYYCGAKPTQIHHHPLTNGAYIYNGIDRVDNTKGYTIDNVVPCCKHCNYAKHQMSLKEYKGWIIKSYNNLTKK